MLRAIPESSSLPLGTKQARLALWIVPPVIAVMVVVVWFSSAGKWPAWPKTSVYDYYGSLAAALQQGHLYLDDQPAPELLALQDPYRIGSRKGIPYLWDASLYEGRYYLYWGPVPALVLLPMQALLARVRVPDIYLAFGFVCALYMVLCGLVLRIWRRHFSMLPGWTLGL